MMKRVFLLLLPLLVPVAVSAQTGDEDTRRWAVDGFIGTAGPMHMKTDGQVFGSTLPSVREGFASGVHVEYFLPYAPFSLKAGYEHEELNFVNQDISSTMKSLSLGGRYYPLPRHWVVQPYTGADLLVNIGAVNDNQSMESYSSSAVRPSYRREARVRLPRFGAASVVGADIRMFSSIYLQMQYSYRLAVGSHVDIRSRALSGNGPVSHDHGTLHRHALSIGLKIAFPFRFTTRDGEGLINLLLDALFPDDSFRNGIYNR